jgi:hypothetical protein
MNTSTERKPVRAGDHTAALRNLLTGGIEPYRQAPRLLLIDAAGSAVLSGAMVLLAVVLGAAPRPFVAFPLVWALGMAIAFFAQGGLSYQLNRRIQQASGSWTVRVCGKPTALLDDASLAAIQLRVLGDPRARARMWMAAYSFCRRVLSDMVRMMPVLVFWLTVGLLFLDPESIDALRSLPAQAWLSGIKLLAPNVLPSLILVWFALASMHRWSIPSTEPGEDARWRIAVACGLDPGMRLSLVARSPQFNADGDGDAELPRISVPRKDVS